MQLSLNLEINPKLNIDNFVINSDNLELIRNLNTLLKTPNILYIYGAQNSGKTHILQAYTLFALNQKYKAFYLDLTQQISENIVGLLLQSDIVFLDNLHIASNENQQLTFDLYNNSANNFSLVITGNDNINNLDILLDLKTRIQKSINKRIIELNNKDKILALKLRLNNKNLKIDDSVLQYLYKNYSRDLNDLMIFIDKLAKTSLINKTKISKKLVKSLLEVASK